MATIAMPNGNEKIELDPYVVDVLLPDLAGHDRHPSAFLLYLYLWRHTGGGAFVSGPLSHATMAENTGLSKRAVQMALDRLVKRRLITSIRTSAADPHSIQVQRPWKRSRR